MTPSRPDQITRLLQAWRAGDSEALNQLTPLVYAQLHRIATRYMASEPANHTLQATALIHEAYLRLANTHSVAWKDRAHFFALAARLMRRILVDSARARGYDKRGGGSKTLSLDEAWVVSPQKDAALVALNEALDRLALTDVRKSRVVELRFFGGLSVDETADVLNVSRDTALRDWKTAKLWLLREMDGKQES